MSVLNCSTLAVFRNASFGEIRAVMVEDTPYFIGKDIADALGYRNGSRDINRHVDEEDRTDVVIHDGSQNRSMIVINESGLYSLILSSELPTAKQFKRWVTAEVLPSIRKDGGYLTARPDETPEMIMARALIVAQSTIERQQAQLTDMAPKARFADSVADTETLILIRDLAKLLKQAGLDTGERRLFDRLRDDGYLIRASSQDRNMPTQRSMDLGLFRVIERTIQAPDHPPKLLRTVKVTGKGQIYFLNKYAGGDLIG